MLTDLVFGTVGRRKLRKWLVVGIDLVGVDLVEVDFMGDDLVGGHHTELNCFLSQIYTSLLFCLNRKTRSQRSHVFRLTGTAA